ADYILEAVRQHSRSIGLQATFDIAGRGHAGIIHAIERAAREGVQNPETAFFVLGVDSYHHPDTLLWLEKARRFAGPLSRSGFIPGEAAGCLVLLSPAMRARLGLPCLAVVSGAHTAQERLLRDSETGSFGVGASQAAQGAMAT